MRKIFVNADTTTLRTLSPFMYKDAIKSLDKSNEARVTLDGVKVFRSCVTSGRDVKNAARTMKYHLYFYATEKAATARDTALREFLPLSQAEYDAYRAGGMMELTTVAAEAAAPAAPVETPEQPVVAAPKAKRAKRETAAA